MSWINNRLYLGLSNFTKVAKGRYTVERNGETYKIEGGKALGGRRSEWFLSGPGFNHDVACTSVRDALRVLESM